MITKVLDESTSLDLQEDDLHRRQWRFRFKETAGGLLGSREWVCKFQENGSFVLPG